MSRAPPTLLRLVRALSSGGETFVRHRKGGYSLSIIAMDPLARGLAVDRAAWAASGDDSLRVELARELHDQVAQSLTTMLIRLEHFKAEQAGRAGVQLEILKLQQDTRDTLQGIRGILKDLRGQPQLDPDFAERLRCDVAAPFERRSGIKTSVRVSRDWPSVLGGHASRHLMRIIQEAINNVQLHSGATRIGIYLLSRPGGEVMVVVKDNGRGLGDWVDSAGLGLLGIRERVVLIGGRLVIVSRPGKGMTIRVAVSRERLL